VSTMRQFDGSADSAAARGYPADGTPARRYPGDGAPGRWPPGPVSGGSPEGRFLSSAGNPLSRVLAELKDRCAAALVQVKTATAALDHAIGVASERKAHHRGGDRPWPLRLVIPLAAAAEALTAFVAMEVLVATVPLAAGLSAMTAMAGVGTACLIANRRLNRLSVPPLARAVEVAFVLVLTLLRYVSLEVQSSDPMAALGGAALAALISALALLAIEEVVVETNTFGVFLSRTRVWLCRRRCSRAEAQLGSCQSRLEAAGAKFQQHYLDFLLKAEGFSLDEAQQRAKELRSAICTTGGMGS
jgi:hypothetical protein